MGWTEQCGRVGQGACVLGIAVVSVVLAVACARPIGSYFRHDDEPPGPIEWETETCEYMGGVDPDAPWPMLQRCPSHAGVSPHLGPTTATVRWSEPCDTTLEGFVVAADGSLLGCSPDIEQLASRDPADGHIQWHTGGMFIEGGLFAGFPAIGLDGTLYVPNVAGMTALSADGSLLWSSHMEDFRPNGAIVISAQPEPVIYVADGQRSILGISTQGSLLSHVRGSDLRVSWQLDVDLLSAYPSLSPHGQLILSGVGDNDPIDHIGVLGTIYPGGAAQQLFSQPGSRLGIPVLDGQGTNYIVLQTTDENMGGTLLAISITGEPLWTAADVTTDEIAPAIGPDGTVYVAAGGGGSPDTFRAYSRGGELLWEAPLPDLPTTHPAIDGAGTAYLGLAGSIVAVDRRGTLLWTHDLAGAYARSLALGADQTLYVQTDTLLIAIGD